MLFTPQNSQVCVTKFAVATATGALRSLQGHSDTDIEINVEPDETQDGTEPRASLKSLSV